MNISFVHRFRLIRGLDLGGKVIQKIGMEVEFPKRKKNNKFGVFWWCLRILRKRSKRMKYIQNEFLIRQERRMKKRV